MEKVEVAAEVVAEASESESDFSETDSGLVPDTGTAVVNLRRSQSLNNVLPSSLGSFNNYVDQILTTVDHLPPSSGKLRTFYILPTL